MARAKSYEEKLLLSDIKKLKDKIDKQNRFAGREHVHLLETALAGKQAELKLLTGE